MLSAIHLPGSFFNSNSARGVMFETPGSGFKVSANSGSATPVRFGSINPSFPNSFSVFSSQKLFTAIDSNIVAVRFFVPVTNQPGAVCGFGSVFTDVDLAGPTTIEFFDFHNNSLGTQTVLNTPGATSLSFLGVSLEKALINRVRITSGNSALSALDSTLSPWMISSLASRKRYQRRQPSFFLEAVWLSSCGRGGILFSLNSQRVSIRYTSCRGAG